MKQVVQTPHAPAAIGPYSQAILAGNLLFVSGQLPIVPETGLFAGDDIISQTRQALQNIQEILKAAGLDMSHVVKTTVLLKNMDEFKQMNEVYQSFFPSEPPARAAYEVPRLPKDALVEIEAVAIKETL